MELNSLNSIAPANVTDDDLVLIWDTTAPAGSNSKKATRGQLLDGVVRSGAAATLTIVDATELNAPVGAIDNLVVATGLTMGGTLASISTISTSVTIPDAAADTTVTAAMTVTGAAVGDVVILSLPSGFPVGMIARADVTAPNAVTVRCYNATAALIATAAYTIRALALRVS